MSNVRGKSDTTSFVHGLTVSQEKCLVKHAREIFTKLVPADIRLGLTDQNRKAAEAAAATALELAELFQRKLMAADYCVRTEAENAEVVGVRSESAGNISDESGGSLSRVEQGRDPRD